MQFQLSVFYSGQYFSYGITTEDKTLFHFILKSAPAGALATPESFMVTKAADATWQFDKALELDFEKSVIHTMKKAKL